MSATQLAHAVHHLHQDAVTVECVSAMRRAGIDPILLKGPGIASWLYGADVRPYGDTDLLVSPAAEAAAEAVLTDLGFRSLLDDGMGVARLHRWTRTGRFVELHVTVLGPLASPQEVWATFSDEPETLPLFGVLVSIPNVCVRVLHVALHAAQHGHAVAQPLEDLRRAVEQVPLPTWARAHARAVDLDAEAAFGTGLRLTPTGAVLAQRLAVSSATEPMVALRAASAPKGAYHLEYLAQIPTWGGRMAYLLRKVFPSPDFLRVWAPVARRGKLGLALAYVLRPCWGLATLPAALLTWNRGRRMARRSKRHAEVKDQGSARSGAPVR